MMMNTLICPLPLFQRLVSALSEEPHRPAFLRVGTHHFATERRWLARDLHLVPPQTARDRAFRVTLRPEGSANETTPLWWERGSSTLAGQLVLGAGAQRGRLAGVVMTENGPEPLQTISLVGAGMYTLALTAHRERNEAIDQRSVEEQTAHTRRSRTIGALGGVEVWERLVRLRVAVIGCGRSGSITALSLARLGVQHLTLIDPDVVELHNLGEMAAVTAADVGELKALALADHLRRERAAVPGAASTLPDVTIHPLTTAVTSAAALSALKRADVMICCVDNDAARLAAALVATLYHKVLLDIATGVHFPTDGASQTFSFSGRQRRMGAEVRLILPGSGCLLCVGNLSRYQQAIEDLCRGVTPNSVANDWRQQRAGSLSTLNQLASSVGVQMLLDLVAERITDSRWARIEFADDGRLAVQYPAVQQANDTPSCLLCAKAGLGDDGLGL